jgi:hypothetical protein
MCKILSKIMLKSNPNFIKFNQNTCTICIENINLHFDLVILKCNHLYHCYCFNNYIKNNYDYIIHKNIKCPLCNDNSTSQLDFFLMYRDILMGN